MYKAITRVTRHSVVLATLLAVTAFASSVHAAAFRTRWDPVFNTDFSAVAGITDVGWRGTALISVDNPCISASTVVSFGNACGVATLESYLLEFYDTGTNAILDSGSGSAPLPMVTAVSFDASSVADGFSIVSPIDAGVFSLGNAGPYRAFLNFALPDPNVQPDPAAGAQLEMVEVCDESCDSYSNDFVNYPATVTWSQVPLPAPISLMVAGIAAMVISRRKRVGE